MWHSKLFLEDRTGRVLVDPTECQIRAGWISDLGNASGCHEIVLRGRVEKDDRSDSVTRTLMPGDPVYLIGNAELNPGAPARAVDSDRLVIRPSSRSSLESRWLRWSRSLRLPLSLQSGLSPQLDPSRSLQLLQLLPLNQLPPEHRWPRGRRRHQR